MQISAGIEIIDVGLLIKKEKVLILSDFHLGYEEALASRGVFIPRYQFKKVIINGDLKHEFGKITAQEWRDIIKLFDYFGKHSEEIIVLKGNHDTILGPVANKRNVKPVKSTQVGNALILHGDAVPKDIPKNVKTIIIGHEHPAISIKDGIRSEIFKCFLKGKWKGKTLISMPSVNPLTEGTNILREKLLSPFLKNEDLSNYRVYILADEIYDFGKVKDVIEI